MAGRCNGTCGCGPGCQCGNGWNRNTNYAGDMKNLLAPILSAVENNTALLESIRREMGWSNHNKQEVKRLGDGTNNNNPKSFVVVDFTATCWKKEENKYGRLKQEIVEFSSVLVDAATGRTMFTFHEFVTPTENRWLSEYCKNYNGIKQEDVDSNYGAMSLDKVLKKHQAWITRLTNGNCVVVTWGDWVCRTMLNQECSRKNLDIPHYFHRWINLWKLFVEVKKLNRYDYWNISVKEALEATGLKWEGAIKGGESHAHNLARLLSSLIRQGANLAITSRLDPAAAACT